MQELSVREDFMVEVSFGLDEESLTRRMGKAEPTMNLEVCRC